MSRPNLRQKPRISYYEPEEPSLDEYIFCDECSDFVFEYCAIHGPLLVIPDNKVPLKTNFPSYVPRAALTIPHVFLHLAPSIIPGAGLGVFSTLTLPRGVRFGPYRGQRTEQVDSMYCWQIYDRNNKRSHVVDAADGDRSNWMRYVNCARHWREQNLLAYQYQGQVYYRTIKIIPRFTELMVFYGGEFANALHINLSKYNSPPGFAQKYGVPVTKKPKLDIRKDKVEDTIPNNIKENRQADMKVIERSKSKFTSDSKRETKAKITCNKENINEKGTNKECKNTDLNNNKDDLKSKNSNYKSSTSKKEKPYKCDICQRSFSHTGNLQTHIRIHTGEKPYKCDICQRSFNQSGNLQNHIRIHTGEKPYKCDICQRSFNRTGHLQNHIRTHTGEKPYKCDICQISFNQSGNLQNHIRKHTGEKPYKCDICQRSFSETGSLKNHIRTHTGEKPYKCDICQRSFSRTGSLQYHIRTHTGEKPYKCDICQRSFSIKCSLKTHIRIHMKNKE